MKKYKNDALKNEFTKGFTCACATMLKEHGESTMVEDCYGNNFHSVKDLKKIGVDEYDIEILKPIIKEIERKKKLNA